jgi:opacity protein-like surface antigen
VAKNIEKNILEIQYMRKISYIILCLFLNISIYAQTGSNMTKVGTTSAQFLKIGMGARAIGMGGAFVSVANDVSAMYWNPAGLARLNSGEVIFTHTTWIADINVEFAAASYELPGFGTIGAYVTSLGMSDIPVTTTTNPEGTGEKYSAGDMAVGLCYSRNLTDAFSIGFGVKYIREYIWHMSSTSFAFDVGTMFTAPFLNGIRLGANISNFGPKMQLDGRDSYLIYKTGPAGKNVINAEYQLENFDLPLLFRVGVSSDVLKQSDMRLTASIDALHPNDNAESINSGMEFAYNEIVFLRVGYKSLFETNSEQGLTAGIGLDYRISSGLGVKVDYAYQDFGRLEAVHHISIGIKF